MVSGNKSNRERKKIKILKYDKSGGKVGKSSAALVHKRR